MSIKNLFLPNISIGDNAYSDIYGICSNYGKNAVIIAGNKSLLASKNLILDNVKDIKINEILYFGGIASYENVEILKNNKKVKNADMIFAVGGGKSLDTAKTLAYYINKPIFTFPTLSSNCAATTSLSVMYNNDGTFKDLSNHKKPPIHIFINTNIILNSPENYFIAGIGDAASKQYETLFSTRNEYLDYKNFLGFEIIKNCSDDILKHYLTAFNDFKNKNISDSLNRIILHIIYTTGLTSVLMKDDYHISLAHAIYNGLTKVNTISKKLLHGELVSYGILLLLTMDKQFDAREQIFNFNKSLSLPTSIKDIGIERANLIDEDLSIVLDNTVSAKDLNISPYKISKDMIFKAIIDLEEFNKNKII